MDEFSYTRFIIDLSAIKSNAKTIKNLVGKNTKMCAMVKANGYGSEISHVAKSIDNLVDCFGVATLSEGIRLRKNGIKSDILIMQPVKISLIDLYAYYNLTPSVGDIWHLNKLSSECLRPLKVHFCIDTGMHRFGFLEKSQIEDAITILKNNKNLILTGAFSHLATKEGDVDYIGHQAHNFEDLTRALPKETTLHLANTNATFNHPNLHYDMVRVGFAIYGYFNNKKLKKSLSIKSELVSVNTFEAGETIGYDRTCTLKRETKVGVVPIGYADGYDRKLSNIAYVLINGKRANVLGNVCMDCFMVDLTNVPDAQIGTEVTILGRSGRTSICLSHYAKWLNESEYACLLKFNSNRMKVEFVE